MDITTYGSLPGIKAIRETAEKVVWWGRQERLLDVSNQIIDSTAVDAGNTPTTDLRAGLLLGKKTSDGNLYQWNPDATDGTEVVYAILLRGISMLGDDGVAEDKYGHILLSGPVKAADLLIEGTLFTSSTAEHLARRQMVGSGKFIFDDELSGAAAFLGAPARSLVVTGATTVTHAQNGTLFVATTADVTFTLPTLEAGLVYEFARADNFNLVVVSAAGDDLIVINDAAADSVTANTLNEKIGVHLRVQSIYTATGTLKWLVSNLSTGAPTLTIAT